MDDAVIWIRLAAAIVVFAGSCFGLGYFAGYWVLRRKGPTWLIGLASVVIALIWPALIFVYLLYSARHHKGDDAVGMVIGSFVSVAVPFLFVLGFPLALTGASIAGRKLGRGGYKRTAEPDREQRVL